MVKLIDRVGGGYNVNNIYRMLNTLKEAFDKEMDFAQKLIKVNAQSAVQASKMETIGNIVDIYV